MKKAFVAILAILYITLTSGVIVNVHYCMGHIASVEYGYDDHDVCGKCGMTGEKEGCCHTEYNLVKVDDEHQSIPADLPSFQMPVSIIPDEIVWIDPAPAKPVTTAFTYEDPPDQYSNSHYLHHCVFLI
ncbi:HYC_CC_PP family protein [Pseudobacter ginsenosidimutans]|uniref:Uncharacterized protein n=1 Tax=Pseudobacter ginsenosidimutans TaxID=661488 RepID=A0A4Q7N3B9_9BACT|nr:hypothetical protein [Pseudobacter ginsenosidimutans]QEC43491.1 hypothetical protein FSB84_18015 [Pseudobacter ginsenosidimutans]RZS74878.1 hypothetical protein EV199_0729 [Pseudobacter ginsenosidimutans]